MKKAYKTALVVSALTSAALFVGAQAFAAHPGGNIILRSAATGNPNIAFGSKEAYSAKATCGGCHDYNGIERHSYHAELGANQHFGWNPWKNGNWNSGAAKGKPWVQSPGHVGKW